MKIEIIDAIKALDPSITVGVSNNDINKIHWHNGNPKKITKEQILLKQKELQSEYEALDYSRKRKEEYPDWGTQLNKIYDDGLEKWKSEMVDPIKAKYPKP